MGIKKQDVVVNSIIGEGTNFRGDFDLNGLLRIDGGFTGTIESDGKVLIGQHGSAKSPRIKARIVVIGGKVDGNIYASEKVTILSTGIINGNIETPRLIAEEGVALNGKVRILESNRARLQHTTEAQEFEAARKELNIPVN